MGSYEIRMAGVLQPKERPRHLKNGHTYTPRATQDQEYAIRRAWQDQVGKMLTGPLMLRVLVVRARPMSHWTPSGKMSAKGVREVVPTTRPDFDNYLKVISDGLSGVAWHDDGQIWGAEFYKVWSSGSGGSWSVIVEDWDSANRGLERTGRVFSGSL